MKLMRIAGLLLAVAVSVPAVPTAEAALIPSGDGLTVHDTTLHVTWMANADLAATTTGKLGIAKITPNGSMDYPTALQWVAALNSLGGGVGYLGHNTWQLPATPVTDPSCDATGPNGDSFGKGCMNSAMGSLFYQSLGLLFPNTAVPIPNTTVGPFNNLQPYLYWSDTSNVDSSKGFLTFSFNTGWEGSNVDKHYIYALAMIRGKLPGVPPATGSGLQVSADGQTVYDPGADVTWLANADLAKTETFGAQCVNGDGTLCINPDGSMSHTTAENWINGMNAAHYLGQSNWQLPPTALTDATCSLQNFGFDCTGSPMGHLFYSQLHLSQGTAAVPTPSINVGPFSNVQPYLYWSCTAAPGSQVLCQSTPPAPGFGWSFSFGNGFTGTDVVGNDLYVMVYYPEPQEIPRRRAARH
ncbi:MAG TPA: hypothetical protein VNN08_18210 [Thermoanaerobaculia bacterium]|nr:hypothetical protein [Thermoanaerobaculia bacterium]